MSLRIWLPLNGSLENKGLDDITPVLTGAVAVDNEGKIGKCYKFGTSLGRITIPPTIMRNYTECSVTFWVNILGWQSNWDTFFQAGLGTAPWNSYIFGVLRNSGNSVVFTISDASSSSQGNYKSSDLTLNTWYHLGFTYKSGHCCIYVNGNLYKDYSTNIIPNFSGINYISLGQLGNASNYQTNCKMNDVRIYDHALSPLEIKHIAQGLILHYPLNRGGWGQENLLKNSKLDGSWEYPSTSYKDQYAPITASVPTGSAYTLSFDAKSTVNGDKIRTHYYSPNTTTTCTSSQGIIKNAVDGSMDFTLSTQWKRYWVVYNQNETSAVKHVICPRMVSGQGTGVVSVKNVKLEEGSIATSWCPNSSDALATTMGLNDNVEYDVSGYCNNGTRTGTFSWTSDTPKYNVSTNILNGSYIDTGYKENIGTGDFTVSVWIKMPQTSGKSYQPIFSNKTTGATSVGFAIYFNQNQNKLLWSTADGSAATEIWMANTINIYDKWMHIVMIRNASDAKKGYFYINGERYELASVPVIRNITNETYNIQVGDIATHNNSAYRYVGLMSDFRIYATALSVEDIKDLYNLGASIDSNNNLLTYELNEE